ncbi:MAG TPA: ThuA domain-containing protein [Bryobacteraceae bacterium]|nr:ThuA domain-containing protein [Bryobacteraceae bacterium]
MRTVSIALFASIALLAVAQPAAAAKPIRAMILDGEQGGPYHAWQETTPYLKKMLDEAGIFQVEVVTAPPAGSDFSTFRPDWGKYQVIVANYDVPDERWPAELKASFESYMRKGGGLVSVHAADNAFPAWRAYNLMIGIGGWRGRDEKAGPLWYYKDGKLASDPTPGKAGSHGARKPFKIVNRDAKHPITKGLPQTWMHVPDELYATLRGPGENMTVLSTAYSDASNKGTSRDEPILMVINFDKGRVFHTTLGHDIAAMNSVGFIATYQRGTEWAATGKVKQKVPADFPTADKATSRPEYNPPAGWVSPGGAPRKPAATPKQN